MFVAVLYLARVLQVPFVVGLEKVTRTIGPPSDQNYYSLSQSTEVLIALALVYIRV